MALAELTDQITDLNNLLRVKSDGGFIEDQNLGIAENRLCQTNPLAVALGQVADQSATDILYPCHLHHAFDLLSALLRGHFFQFCRKKQIFFHRHLGVEGWNFRQVSDLSLCLLRLPLDIFSINCHRSLGWRQIAGYHVHCRGFSGAVWSQKTVNLSLFHAKRQVIHRRVITVSFGKIGYFDHTSSHSAAVRLSHGNLPDCYIFVY